MKKNYNISYHILYHGMVRMSLNRTHGIAYGAGTSRAVVC